MQNEKGQTTVEYVLLLAVIVAVMTSVFRQLEQYMVAGPNSLQAQFVQSFSSTFAGQNGAFQGQYKFYRIRK